MNEKIYKLFEDVATQEIVDILEKELESRNESLFWSQRVVPFTKAILSVLGELSKQELLFDPQGNYKDKLTPELFFEWTDFVSLKQLAFTIQKSNDANKLLRTKLDNSKCGGYKAIELSELGSYLSKNLVNLENEYLDFPISTYNIHQGVTNVIKTLLNPNYAIRN